MWTQIIQSVNFVGSKFSNTVKDLFPLKNLHIGSGFQLEPYSMSSFPEISQTTHLHPVPGLKQSEVITPFSLCRDRKRRVAFP